MSALDWAVLLGTTLLIIGYGLCKSRGAALTGEQHLRGGGDLPWHTIGLSVMATQASAITFLSVPGQAYEDGLRFVQFYFGLPLAMVVICAFILPRYYGLRVITAYEYLESRFDTKTRVLGALLFLVQRGLAAGITIYAPAIILSAVLGWPLEATVVGIGSVVILYTVTGGSRAVSQTQKQQMIVMMGGMVVAAVVIARSLPEEVALPDAVAVAGALGRMNAVSFEFDLNDRYNFWSGITGGFFLALAYFGTDQSQVGRYLGGRSMAESRLGLLFNGLFKIPMQFLILFVGILVFVFYQFAAPPLLFNAPLERQVQQSAEAPAFSALQTRWDATQAEKQAAARRFVAARHADDATAQARAADELRRLHARAGELRGEAKATVLRAVPGAETKDADFVFIRFVTRWLPEGLVGLLVAVILFAAMSSTASELTALGQTTTVDLWRRLLRPDVDDRTLLLASKGFTVFWGLVALAFASFASLLDNLIQAVNILGSIFYGTTLGVFLAGFFLRRVGANAVFFAAVVSQVVVVALFFGSSIGFLWFNVIGCVLVMALAVLFSVAVPEQARASRVP
ncbi:MAG: hypothetical protein RIT45_1131 [Pseudomonadota bacterium]